MYILVAGASGYIANRLIPQLLERGHRVRALARSPQNIDGRRWAQNVEILQGDVTQAESLARAMQDINAIYSLVHNMSAGRGYTDLEIISAQNTARAAEAAGVKHIIYLGGLADPEQSIAPHMRSRIETGRTLRQGGVPVTELRAGVVIGSGSISFEMIRFMTELLPLIPAPQWLKNKSQPIAVQNVIDYLLAALENPNGRGQVLEIGGPTVTSYQEMMKTYARLRGLRRRFFLLPYIPLEFMAFGVGLATPVPRPIARALIGGLSRDSVVLHNNAQDVYKLPLIDFQTAMQDALTNLHPQRVERVWTGDQTQFNPLKHEGFFIRQKTTPINLSPVEALAAMERFHAKKFLVEERLDNALLLRKKSGGAHWLEYQIHQDHDLIKMTKISFFAPHGLWGFLSGLAT